MRRRGGWLWALAALATAVVAVLGYRKLLALGAGGPLTFTRHGVHYELLQPSLLGVLLVAPLLVWVLGRSLADLPFAQRLVSLGLRLAFLGLLGLALARLVRTEEAKSIALVALVDVSDSVPEEALRDARATIEKLYRARGHDDTLRLVTFATRPRLVELERDGKLALPASLRHGSRGSTPSATTNVAGALQLAYGLFPAGRLKRVLLLTDGVETDGDLLAESARARELGVRLSIVPYRHPPPAEVAVVGLRLPDKVDVGQAFEIAADVYASRATRARVRLPGRDAERPRRNARNRAPARHE